MRNLVNMDGKSDIGHIDWEFIHDMHGIAPEFITPELIHLTDDFLAKIPEKWKEIRRKLARHTRNGAIVHVAIEDVENLGNDFKARGILKNRQGQPLAFHRIVMMDKDLLESDYLGSVITKGNGEFSLSFGQETFSHLKLEANPDVFFKVFEWRDQHFVPIGEVTPEIHEKVEVPGGKKILEFGVVEL